MKNISKAIISTFLFIAPFALVNAETSQAPLTDTAITAFVKAKLATTPALTSNKVHVTTTNGQVELSGIVPSDTDASQIVELVQATKGVKDVNADNLNVTKSTQPLKDTFITAKIKGLFLREKLFGNSDVAVVSINVETKNGTVYLSGTADNELQINNAERIAKSVKDVKEVNSQVKVIAPVKTPVSKKAHPVTHS